MPYPAFPTVVVYRWQILISPGWRLAVDQSGQRGVGGSMAMLSLLCFCHSFVSAQLTYNHGWASWPFAGNWKTPRRLHLPRHLRGHGHDTAVVTPSQKHIKTSNADTQTLELSNYHLSCLAHPKEQWPVATQPGISGRRNLRRPLAKFGWSLKFTAPQTKV